MVKSESLFVGDHELVKRLNLPKSFNIIFFQVLQDKEGFPKPDLNFGGKRYFPAVVQWLDHFHRLKSPSRMMLAPVFMTDAEVAKQLGVATTELKIALPTLFRYGFPVPNLLFAKRRYWPAVREWFDLHHGLEVTGSRRFAADGPENEGAFRKSARTMR